MHISDKGLAVLKDEEGEVLRAYRCPAGRWTIGVGLTAASGVVKPKAGMVITREQSDALTRLALRENYEPAVEVAMARVAGSAVWRPKQYEFDAGVLFHWNTGAIRKASWVKKWKEGALRQSIRHALLQWVKGGGKVLPGLVARREREAKILLDGVYPPGHLSGATAINAAIVVRLSPSELASVRLAFRKLGYDPGDFIDAVRASSVVRFQRDHGLTDDGIIGRATLSTLQRRLDAPKAAAKPALAGSVAAVAPTDVGQGYFDAVNIGGAEWVALGLIGLWGLSVAWSYRDVIATKISRLAPRLATFLRSF